MQFGFAHQVVIHQHGDALAVPCQHVAGVGVEVRVDVRVPHHAQVVVVAHQVVALQDNVAHRVGGVLQFGIAPAHAEEVPAQLEEHLREVLARFCSGQRAGGLALAVEVNQVEVEPAVAVAVAHDAIHHHAEVDPLHALVVGARRLSSDVGATLGDA